MGIATEMGGISAGGREELARAIGRGRRFVTAADVSGALGVDHRTAVGKLGGWHRNGWLRRVRRDLYIPVPVDAEDAGTWSEDPFLVGDELWAPCYFSGWTAAGHWRLTDQVFRTIVVKTTGRVRASSVTVLGQEYLLTHAHERELRWGLAAMWRGDRRLSVSSAERTVVDIMDEPRLGGGIRHGAEILAEYLDEHDTGALVAAAEMAGNRTVLKRLGYLLSVHGADRELIEQCRSGISKGFSLLDPAAPARGPWVRDWNLRVNVTVEPQGAS